MLGFSANIIALEYNLLQQQEAAKPEVGKPFPQEEELRLKSARLAELDAELNIGAPQQKTA